MLICQGWGVSRTNYCKLNMDLGMGMQHGTASTRGSQEKVSEYACKCRSHRDSTYTEEEHGDVTYPSL